MTRSASQYILNTQYKYQTDIDAQEIGVRTVATGTPERRSPQALTREVYGSPDRLQLQRDLSPAAMLGSERGKDT